MDIEEERYWKNQRYLDDLRREQEREHDREFPPELMRQLDYEDGMRRVQRGCYCGRGDNFLAQKDCPDHGSMWSPPPPPEESTRIEPHESGNNGGRTMGWIGVILFAVLLGGAAGGSAGAGVVLRLQAAKP